MTTNEVMEALSHFGNEQTKKTYIRHGATEPLFGVKIGDLKKIQKQIKKNQELANSLYSTGNSDAMYLAGMIADKKVISKEQLQQWVEKATWYHISEYAVAGIAADSKHGLDLGLEWIQSDTEIIASAGWATLANLISIRPDQHIDKMLFSTLLDKVQNEIVEAQNRVRYTMNGFVIAVGTFIESLTREALEVAAKIGKVDVNMGKTACKIPFAFDYINKVIAMDKVGHKKKSARC